MARKPQRVNFMRYTAAALLFGFIFFFAAACSDPPAPGSRAAAAKAKKGMLADARKGFTTQLTKQVRDPKPPVPPPHTFTMTQYRSGPNMLAAYVTRPANTTDKVPAIIWLVGGFDNDMPDKPWETQPEDNDQSASIFDRKGIYTMYASLRGGVGNGGVRESMYGEVDDVVAALKHLKSIPYIDQKRIYLGGHSTGGTLALLAAECSGEFRAVLSLGPVASESNYPAQFRTYKSSDEKETSLRSPGEWLHCVASPTFVMEGGDGNIRDLRVMRRATDNPSLHFYEVPNGSHFNIIRPLCKLFASKILSDTGPTCNIAISDEDVAAACAGIRPKR